MADTSFRDYLLDQLRGIPKLRAKAMFGGYGIYSDDVFFAIVMEGRVYFYTNDQTRNEYIKRGMPPFIYEKARGTSIIHYYEVPPEVLENPEAIQEWARTAISGRGNAPRKK